MVVGGGFAGMCAAIAAARQGIKTALVEQRAVLGGNGSSLVRVHIGGSSDHGRHFDARESGIIEELRLAYSVKDPGNTYAWIDQVLQDACAAEPNLVVFYSTVLAAVTTEVTKRDGYSIKITGCSGFQQDTETNHVFRAKFFIDGTGDGVLGALAGAEYRMGREGRDEFHESLAPDKPDKCTLGSSIMFEARDMGHPVPFTPPSWAKKMPKDYSDKTTSRQPRGGSHENGYWHGDMHVGWWWIEYGGTLDTIADNDRIKDELLAILYGLWDHVKNSGDWRYKNALNYDITWMGQIPGKRESRRLVGDYMLTEVDEISSTCFEDQVATGGWNIDLHPPEGFYDKAPPCSQLMLKDLYSIPYRCIYSRNVENLFIASRCLSVSHVAHGSTRLQGTLAAIGQAAGIAAAECVKRGFTPRVLGTRAINEFQQNLVKNDGFVLNLKDTDQRDLALSASITASSSKPLSFEQNDAWIPILFPIAQQFPGFPVGKEGSITTIDVLIKNDLPKFVKMTGSVGTSMALGDIQASTASIKMTGIAPASKISWVRFELEVPLLVQRSLDAANPALLWFRLDSPDCDANGVFVGKDLDHYPGFRTAFFDEDNNIWMVPRLHDSATFFTPVVKPRGVFNFKVPGFVAFPAENAIDGLNRPSKNASNLWMSDPVASFPQSLELDLHGLKTISEVHITTDTGLDKPYPHKYDGDYKPWPVPGKAPRCPKDFEVLIVVGKMEKKVASVKDNIQRKVIIKLFPVNAETVKIVFHSSNGGKEIGIYEIRVY
nr:FAD-dependent oxidoreductase [Candidatus Sigynarchaeota archaeon]